MLRSMPLYFENAVVFEIFISLRGSVINIKTTCDQVLVTEWLQHLMYQTGQKQLRKCC